MQRGVTLVSQLELAQATGPASVSAESGRAKRAGSRECDHRALRVAEHHIAPDNTFRARSLICDHELRICGAVESVPVRSVPEACTNLSS